MKESAMLTNKNTFHKDLYSLQMNLKIQQYSKQNEKKKKSTNGQADFTMKEKRTNKS